MIGCKIGKMSLLGRQGAVSSQYGRFRSSGRNSYVAGEDVSHVPLRFRPVTERVPCAPSVDKFPRRQFSGNSGARRGTICRHGRDNSNGRDTNNNVRGCAVRDWQ